MADMNMLKLHSILVLLQLATYYHCPTENYIHLVAVVVEDFVEEVYEQLAKADNVEHDKPVEVDLVFVEVECCKLEGEEEC